MKNYLLNVTFYVGSMNEEDTDRALFSFCIDKEMDEEEIKDIFQTVNKLLAYRDYYEDDQETAFPISYDRGLNIYTLMYGIALYTKGNVREIESNCGNLKFDNYYYIEQWY